jgi:serine/threonine protein kinase
MSRWWVPTRIEATVTRTFVLNQLGPDQIARLDQPLAFGGEDLTERTYWDSIDGSAKRFFLILVDLGIPDQIFTIVDNGWDDDELPLSLDDIDRLQLTPVKDDRFDRKFYQLQFHYVLRTIDRGTHVSYDDHGIVPLDVVDRSPGLTTKGNLVDKVKLPNVPNAVFSRRKYPLGNSPGCIPLQDFFDAIASMKALKNDHIISYWASYTYQGYAYILLTPCSDFTLKSFLANTPSSFKTMGKRERRLCIVNWILCLVDTLTFLHKQNRSHCFIKPSTILFNNQNQVFFADANRLSPDAWTSRGDKSSFDREWYDYAAPEQWFRPAGPASPPGRGAMLAHSTSPENVNFNISRGMEPSTPNAMLHTPNPQLNPQQADVFSLGCVILELLSFLLKKSSSKFASFRSAKHKMAGRGGAVLDASFHKNLGQVEPWMSGLAKEASKKSSDPDSEGSEILRGITPMLHVVTGMLAVNPHERPSARDVQQRMYQILVEICGVREPHCVHQYSTNPSTDLQRSFAQLRLGGGGGAGAPGPSNPPVMRQSNYPNMPNGNGARPRAYQHVRSGSSGGYSQASSNTTGSSERDEDSGYAASRAVPPPQPIRSSGRPTGNWAGKQPVQYLGNPGKQPSLYATAQ